MKRVTLKEAIEFHGHLGPYLVLGVLAGELALKKLRCRKYSGLDVKVRGATHKPKSCLIDGLQLATGATYGKGNIEKLDGSIIRIESRNCLNQKKAVFKIKDIILKRLEEAKTHDASEALARELYNADYSKLFDLT